MAVVQCRECQQSFHLIVEEVLLASSMDLQQICNITFTPISKSELHPTLALC